MQCGSRNPNSIQWILTQDDDDHDATPRLARSRLLFREHAQEVRDHLDPERPGPSKHFAVHIEPPIVVVPQGLNHQRLDLVVPHELGRKERVAQILYDQLGRLPHAPLARVDEIKVAIPRVCVLGLKVDVRAAGRRQLGRQRAPEPLKARVARGRKNGRCVALPCPDTRVVDTAVVHVLLLVACRILLELVVRTQNLLACHGIHGRRIRQNVPDPCVMLARCEHAALEF
ncbi:hypothetical protein PsorP6_005631 [Peronosclerospora sorghi]|uniref:Uncharacterized protein n=1 Tax=Peronosclerospora sorghi TaxID=230839 RepID=A0ACC0W4S0_9STRA|nr:hypothetical protein PsorP6_005631 [Peronosclerospora sorghi]